MTGLGMASLSDQFETTPPRSKHIILPVSPSKSSYVYQVLDGSDLSDDLIDSCAKLFSSNYGVWGEKAPTISRFTKTGS
jgi:hypothetical protein